MILNKDICKGFVCGTSDVYVHKEELTLVETSYVLSKLQRSIHWIHRYNAPPRDISSSQSHPVYSLSLSSGSIRFIWQCNKRNPKCILHTDSPSDSLQIVTQYLFSICTFAKKLCWLLVIYRVCTVQLNENDSIIRKYSNDFILFIFSQKLSPFLFSTLKFSLFSGYSFLWNFYFISCH